MLLQLLSFFVLMFCAAAGVGFVVVAPVLVSAVGSGVRLGAAMPVLAWVHEVLECPREVC